MHLKLKRRTKMTKTKFTTLTLLIVLISTILSAEVKQQNTQAPCSTRVECDAMVKDLQRKIDVLNKKIINLKGSEKRKLYRERQALNKEKTIVLLASKDLELAQAKAKTAQQRKIIAEEKEKQIQEKEKQAEIIKTNKKLDEIKALLKK